MAPASTAACVTSTSTESSKTWALDWIQKVRVLGLPRAADSGWVTAWNLAASRVREASASRATATQRVTVASRAHATLGGRALFVTSKLATLVTATSEWKRFVLVGLSIKRKARRSQILKEKTASCRSSSIHVSLPHLTHRCIHGTCVPINSYSYSCRCQPGFAGVLCDEQDPEAANPCSLFHCKHGKCRISGLGQAYCECDSGYTGEACDRGEKNKDSLGLWHRHSSVLFNLLCFTHYTFCFPA